MKTRNERILSMDSADFWDALGPNAIPADELDDVEVRLKDAILNNDWMLIGIILMNYFNGFDDDLAMMDLDRSGEELDEMML